MYRHLNNRPGDQDYLTIEDIEDLFAGYDVFLAYLIENLVGKGILAPAKRIEVRNPGVSLHLKPHVLQ